MENTLSIEELLEKIEELELLNTQLLLEQQQESNLDYAWSGNLGHWYWNIKTNSMIYNPLKITTMGYTIKDIPKNVSYQFFLDRVHPEDHNRVSEAMQNHLNKKSDVYEIEYRIKTKKGDYKWFYDRGSVTKLDADGKPLFVSGIVFDITKEKTIQVDLEVTNQVLSRLSRVDDLTNILNHRGIMDGLKHEIERSRAVKETLSIALFDIDNFKIINDTNGHNYGDYVLKEIASIMSTSLRDADMVGRYGGDDFLIIFSGSNAEGAKLVSERIRKRVEEYNFNDSIKITISGGVCEYSNDEDMFALINRADKKLNHVKKSGRNYIE